VGESWNPDAGNSGTFRINQSASSASAQDKPAYDWSRFNRPFGELKPATFAPTQQIGYRAADALTALGMQPYTANDLAKRIGNVLGLTPLGLAGSALDLIDAKHRNDFPGAVAAAIGMIPGAKGVARGVAEEAGAGLRTLYHYTNEAGLNAILKEGKLNPSLKALRPRDVRHGNGQYLTDILPGSMAPDELSKALVQNPHQVDKFTHYLEINPGGLNVIEGRRGVYVISNEVPLDLNNRVISSGKVPGK